jgi:hypothetical protein
MTDREEASAPSGQNTQLLLNSNLDCLAEMKLDAHQLALDLLLLKDALRYRVIKPGWTVLTAIEFIGNGEAIVALHRNVDPGSKFHGDFLAFRDLLLCLTGYMEKETFSEDDRIKDAQEKMEEKAFDLNSILHDYK